MPADQAHASPVPFHMRAAQIEAMQIVGGADDNVPQVLSWILSVGGRAVDCVERVTMDHGIIVETPTGNRKALPEQWVIHHGNGRFDVLGWSEFEGLYTSAGPAAAGLLAAPAPTTLDLQALAVACEQYVHAWRTMESSTVLGSLAVRVAEVAAPAIQPNGRRWCDRQGAIWLETVVSTSFLQVVEHYDGEVVRGGAPQSVEDVERKWGPLVPVEPEGVASPAAPADDEALKRLERKLDTLRAIAQGVSSGADDMRKEIDNVTRALAALREGKQQ